MPSINPRYLGNGKWAPQSCLDKERDSVIFGCLLILFIIVGVISHYA